MNRRLAWLGIATAALLLAALLGADRLRKDGPDGPEVVAPLATAPGQTPAAGSDGEVYRGDVPRLSGTARSLAFEGRIVGLGRITLANDVTLLTEVFDAQGRPLGRGTLSAEGRSTTLQGAGLAADTAFTASRPGPITIERGSLSAQGDVTISAPKLTLSTAEQPDGRPLSSPVLVKDLDNVAIEAPATIDERVLKLGTNSNRTTLSWAGGGQIQIPGHRAMTGQWLGIKAQNVDVTLQTADLRIEGTFEARQVYVDGSPRLKADKVQVDLVDPAEAVAPGGRTWFDWAPRNRSDIDMVITRIRPDSPQAAWINLALDRMPAMFGGERREPGGGDTGGLGKNGGGGFFGGGKAAAIDAVILPRTADRESVSVDVPAGTPPGVYQLAVVFEGNFDPVRVVIPVEVAGAAPPT